MGESHRPDPIPEEERTQTRGRAVRRRTGSARTQEDPREQQRDDSRQKRRASGSADRGDNKKKTRTEDKTLETEAERGLKRDREESKLATYRRCRVSRQRDIRDTLVGPNGRDVGETGEMDTG